MLRLAICCADLEPRTEIGVVSPMIFIGIGVFVTLTLP